MTNDISPDPLDGAPSRHDPSSREEANRPTNDDDDDDDDYNNNVNGEHPTAPSTRSPSPTVSLPPSWSTYPTRPTISSSPPNPLARQAMSGGGGGGGGGGPSPPFAVPKPWQHALSMVSINAGLTPQALLHAYRAQQPRQAAQHPGHTDLDARQLFFPPDPDEDDDDRHHHHHHHQARRRREAGAGAGASTHHRHRDRGIRGVRVRCADGDPARLSLLAIAVDDVDPATGGPVVRLVTNTSVRHVLEEPCADCPLWLPVRATAAAAAGGEGATKGGGGGGGGSDGRTYQIVPCCDEWAAAVDFELPLSAEEKQVPAVVDRLIQELQRKRLALMARERDLQDREDELDRLRRRLEHLRQAPEGGSGEAVATAPVVEQRPQLHHALVFDADVLAQYWWAAAMVVAFMLVIIVLK